MSAQDLSSGGVEGGFVDVCYNLDTGGLVDNISPGDRDWETEW